jgi:hypothetical protein
MKTLRREAVRCLRLEFPSTLSEWSKSPPLVIDILQPSTSLFEILYLAHEHSITSILPALYLRICLLEDLVSQIAFNLTATFELMYNCRTKSLRAFSISQIPLRLTNYLSTAY